MEKMKQAKSKKIYGTSFLLCGILVAAMFFLPGCSGEEEGSKEIIQEQVITVDQALTIINRAIRQGGNLKSGVIEYQMRDSFIEMEVNCKIEFAQTERGMEYKRTDFEEYGEVITEEVEEDGDISALLVYPAEELPSKLAETDARPDIRNTAESVTVRQMDGAVEYRFNMNLSLFSLEQEYADRQRGESYQVTEMEYFFKIDGSGYIVEMKNRSKGEYAVWPLSEGREKAEATPVEMVQHMKLTEYED